MEYEVEHLGFRGSGCGLRVPDIGPSTIGLALRS